MTSIETIVQLQLNTTSVSSSASETFISDLSYMHQTTNGVIVKQTNLDISKGKTSRTFSVTFVYIEICLKIISEN